MALVPQGFRSIFPNYARIHFVRLLPLLACCVPVDQPRHGLSWLTPRQMCLSSISELALADYRDHGRNFNTTRGARANINYRSDHSQSHRQTPSILRAAEKGT